jgi:plastocyanin domain-containing protein
VKRDTPVRLVFNRQETSSCSEEVVLSAFGIRRFLPPFQKTAVELTPHQSGTFDITCGMSMLHAKLVVED